LVLDTQLGMTIFDVTGVYDAGADGKGFALLYGGRLINQRNNVDAMIEFDHQAGESTSLDSSDTFVDGLIGVRYVGSLPGRWSYAVAADASTGGTELTWSASPMIGYTFGADSQYQLTAGYRHMVVDFDTAASVDMDMTLSGFLIGFRYAF
jgi:hypothetical protein